MELKEINIEKAMTINDISKYNINYQIFRDIVDLVQKVFKKLNINSDNMIIYYERDENAKSVLAIKVSEGEDEDINNYMFNGCEVGSSGFCDVYLHARAKSGQLAMGIANLISRDIVSFFESIEKDLKEKDLGNLQLSLTIPLGQKKNIQKEESTYREKGFGRILRMIRRKK